MPEERACFAVLCSCEILTRSVAMIVGLAAQILAVVHLAMSKDKQVIILLVATTISLGLLFMECVSILSTMNRRPLLPAVTSMSDWGLIPRRRIFGHFFIAATILVGVIMAVTRNLAAARAETNCQYKCSPPPAQSRSRLNGHVWGVAAALFGFHFLYGFESCVDQLDARHQRHSDTTEHRKVGSVQESGAGPSGLVTRS